ncbi:MAG TPA: Lrp/AsnC ligand binding domain-containing protein [Steroidobacteraceae bacterium]|nr:Lrp/AsnC ligand binding domain-containing protein [Steroidobacteraceae bacterium]
MVSAVVLIKAQTDSVNELASAIANLEGVREVFSVAGHYDLVALVNRRENEELADLVSGKIRKLPGILATETLIAFRVYSRAELEVAGSFGLD